MENDYDQKERSLKFLDKQSTERKPVSFSFLRQKKNSQLRERSRVRKHNNPVLKCFPDFPLSGHEK